MSTLLKKSPMALEVDSDLLAGLAEKMSPLEGRIAPDCTLECGQVFHWVNWNQGAVGRIGESLVFVRPLGEGIEVTSGFEREAARYFSLDLDLGAITASFPDDAVMQRATEFSSGMRILRQPVWECLATFIGSAQKQVAHIRQNTARMRVRFGGGSPLQTPLLHPFPGPERVASLQLEDLLGCGLGYRAKNLLATARVVAGGSVDLEGLASLPVEEAREKLCKLPGVGEKIANCVLLFSCEAWEAFPVDVWIDRVIRELYLKRKRRVTAARVRDFCADYFGPWGGYAQQYLFHYARTRYGRSAQLTNSVEQTREISR